MSGATISARMEMAQGLAATLQHYVVHRNIGRLSLHATARTSHRRGDGGWLAARQKGHCHG